MFRDLSAAILIFIIVFASFYRGDPFISLAVLFVVFVLAIVIRERTERARIDFFNQLKSCRRELRNGSTVVVDNELIRYNTVLATYYGTVGGLISSITIPSRYVVVAGHDQPHSLLYSLASILSGWWAFPTGPLMTVNCIRQNLVGGEQTSVALLIDGILIRRAVEKQYPAEEFSIEEAVGENAISEAELSLPETGEDSPSAKKLSNTQLQATGKSLEERVQELEDPRFRRLEALRGLFHSKAVKKEKPRNIYKKQPLRKQLGLKKVSKDKTASEN